MHYVYAALRPKSNEKAATITEYKTIAKQTENRATTTIRTTTSGTTTSRTTTSRTNALLIALLNGNS